MPVYAPSVRLIILRTQQANAANVFQWIFLDGVNKL